MSPVSMPYPQRDRNNTRQNLGITSTINFRAEEIATTSAEKADIAIALHACDTATDDAIAWAINGGVKLTYCYVATIFNDD